MEKLGESAVRVEYVVIPRPPPPGGAPPCVSNFRLSSAPRWPRRKCGGRPHPEKTSQRIEHLD
jgi:hypothetical protein